MSETLEQRIRRMTKGDRQIIAYATGVVALLKEKDAELAAQQERIRTLEDVNERFEDTLREIANWAKAYPLKVFPEPDFKRAHELLQAGGMTIDAISASNMRHVVKRVAEIAAAALEAR